jgi:4-coumarate--CoA ligase
MNSSFDPETKIWSGIKIPYSFPMDLMIGDLLLASLLKTPERVLQISKSDDKAITCDEMRISMIRVAQNLAKIGIKEDDVVGIIVPQSHFTTSIIYGCIALGALINPLHPAMSETDISGVFAQTRPKIIICQPDAISKVQRALKDVDFNYRIYSTSTKSSLFLKAQNFIKPTGYEDSFKLPKFSKLANEKNFAILCSSGTTGMPKVKYRTRSNIFHPLNYYFIGRLHDSHNSFIVGRTLFIVPARINSKRLLLPESNLLADRIYGKSYSGFGCK